MKINGDSFVKISNIHGYIPNIQTFMHTRIEIEHVRVAHRTLSQWCV
jgi:hypothetical protein